MLPLALGAQSPGGVLTQDVMPGTQMSTVDRLRSEAARLAQEAYAEENRQPDLASIQEYMKSRASEGESAMLNALAAQFAGQQFEPVQAQYLKRAAAAREPMKVGAGMFTPQGEFVRDPFVEAERRALSKARQAESYERMAQAAEAAEQRRQDVLAERQRQADFRQAQLGIQQQGLDLRKLMAERRQETPSGSFTSAGFTPEGAQVVQNTKSGVNYLLTLQPDGTPAYSPYQGPMIPKGTFEKNVEAARTFSSKAASADDLLKRVEGAPEAFGLTAAALSALPAQVQGRASSLILKPETLKLRADVLRQAAMEISDIYGAAQSVGEAARAAQFIPNREDPPDVVIAKLRAARDYAKANAAALGGAAVSAAQQRTGQPAPSQQTGLTAEEQAEYDRLRKKYGR